MLRAREGQETLLEAELRALVGPSRREEGCLTYNLPPVPRYTRGAAAARSLGQPRSAHRAHTHATLSSLERQQRHAARLSRCQLLEADFLRLIAGQLSGVAR